MTRHNIGKIRHVVVPDCQKKTCREHIEDLAPGNLWNLRSRNRNIVFLIISWFISFNISDTIMGHFFWALLIIQGGFSLSPCGVGLRYSWCSQGWATNRRGIQGIRAQHSAAAPGAQKMHWSLFLSPPQVEVNTKIEFTTVPSVSLLRFASLISISRWFHRCCPVRGPRNLYRPKTCPASHQSVVSLNF